MPDNPDKRRQKTGITGMSPHRNRTSFRKGQSGNPAGRPKGSGRFRGGARVAAMLLDSQAERLAETAIEMALAGDPVAVRFCLGRLIGTRRGQPLVLDDVRDFPAVSGPGDLGPAIAALTAALAEGRVTPEEALHLSQMLDALPPLFDAARTVPSPEEAAREEERIKDEIKRKLDRLAARLNEDENSRGEPAGGRCESEPWTAGGVGPG